MSSLWLVLSLAGIAVIAGLSFYLGKLLMQIRQVEAQRQQQVEQRNSRLGGDIHTIAWAMRDGQCDFSEGCIRLWVLLDHLIEEQPVDNQQRYPGIFSLYEKIKDMPTHQARKAQNKLERLKMDADRLSYEEQFGEAIQSDINNLLDRFSPQQ